MITLANEFLQAIRFLAPRDTGQYASSWVIQSIDDNHVTIATPKGGLAVYLEYGTQPHPIFPRRRKVLHWEDASGDHFALYVRHPGFPAKPHIRPATNVVESKIQEIAKQMVSKYFKI